MVRDGHNKSHRGMRVYHSQAYIAPAVGGVGQVKAVTRSRRSRAGDVYLLAYSGVDRFRCDVLACRWSCSLVASTFILAYADNGINKSKGPRMWQICTGRAVGVPIQGKLRQIGCIVRDVLIYANPSLKCYRHILVLIPSPSCPSLRLPLSFKFIHVLLFKPNPSSGLVRLLFRHTHVHVF